MWIGGSDRSDRRWAAGKRAGQKPALFATEACAIEAEEEPSMGRKRLSRAAHGYLFALVDADDLPKAAQVEPYS